MKGKCIFNKSGLCAYYGGKCIEERCNECDDYQEEEE